MSRDFPDIVDPQKAADGRRTFEGTMPLGRMKRLLPLLAPESTTSGSEHADSAEAWFSARFGFDEQGLVIIRMKVKAELPLVCQRSLVTYRETVERSSLLAVIGNVNEQETLPGNYEPVLVESGRLALLDVVEDELLIGVPQIPRNPDLDAVEMSTDGEPVSPVVEKEEKTHRPFEGLAGLMKDSAGS
jgi:uncharacterized protein